MGIYDTIEDVLFCPFCGKQQKEHDFQSKDLGRSMHIWDIKSIKMFFPKKPKLEIYSQCSYCKEWISINLDLMRMKKDVL